MTGQAITGFDVMGISFQDVTLRQHTDDELMYHKKILGYRTRITKRIRTYRKGVLIGTTFIGPDTAVTMINRDSTGRALSWYKLHQNWPMSWFEVRNPYSSR